MTFNQAFSFKYKNKFDLCAYYYWVFNANPNNYIYFKHRQFLFYSDSNFVLYVWAEDSNTVSTWDG